MLSKPGLSFKAFPVQLCLLAVTDAVIHGQLITDVLIHGLLITVSVSPQVPRKREAYWLRLEYFLLSVCIIIVRCQCSVCDCVSDGCQRGVCDCVFQMGVNVAMRLCAAVVTAHVLLACPCIPMAGTARMVRRTECLLSLIHI